MLHLIVFLLVTGAVRLAYVRVRPFRDCRRCQRRGCSGCGGSGQVRRLGARLVHRGARNGRK